MKKFIDSFINVWKIEELKNRILLTLGLLLVYRFGAQVTLPGIDATKLTNLTNQTDLMCLLQPATRLDRDVHDAFT